MKIEKHTPDLLELLHAELVAALGNSSREPIYIQSHETGATIAVQIETGEATGIQGSGEIQFMAWLFDESETAKEVKRFKLTLERLP